MSALTSDIIRMANQIVDEFPYLSEPERVEAVAFHIRRFWERRMLASLFEHIDEGADGLDAEVVAAAARLRAEVS